MKKFISILLIVILYFSWTKSIPTNNYSADDSDYPDPIEYPGKH